MKFLIHLFSFFFLTRFVLATTAASAAQPPNVVIIFADDLGWSDTTLYGTTNLYNTPNIERLAKRGMVFTQAYSASPLCSPTRASLLTGLSPARHGITAPNCHVPEVVLNKTIDKTAAPSKPSVAPRSITRLATHYQTLPKSLKAAGYKTAHFGKWHLGSEPYSALEHGFDIDVPHWPGPGPAGSFVAPWQFPDFDPDTPDQHIEDRMAIEASEFMTANRDRPFFLNYWMFSVHAPFDAKEELINKYRSVVDPNDTQRSPIYAAMVESMDDAVGTLLDTLDRLEIADNTIVIFSSDNGGNMYDVVEDTTATSNRPLRGGKATMYEGGIRVPQIVSWPGHIQEGSQTDVITNTCDIYPTLLDMLSLKPADGQTFDGVSIVPALQGKLLDREAIFTYFPHDPPVPDWMPPAVSIHKGDWKLIRLFACGDNGGHRWKLFHLRDDIGEQNDLSSKNPDAVQKLDSLIEAFLVDTNATVPIANPSFDRANYRVEDEGKPGAGHFGSTAKKRKSTAKPALGWNPSGDCEVTARATAQGKTLIVESFGGDPYVHYNLPNAFPGDSPVLEFSLKSTSQGHGQVFWLEEGGPRAHGEKRRITLEIIHDGESHDYKVPIPAAGPVRGIRIDPATAAGKIEISGIKLRSANGEESVELLQKGPGNRAAETKR